MSRTPPPVPPDQSAVIAFLSDPATHGGMRPEVIETHAALVFLAGDTAWKMKRAVRYDYLDFTDTGARRAMLERELELNRPAAPAIYHKVMPVTRGPEGLRLGGAGPAVDWVLRMRRFDAEDELSSVAARGELDVTLATRLGHAVAAMHDRAPVHREDGAALLREIVEELVIAFEGMTAELGTDARATTEALRSAYHSAAPLLAARGAAGMVRRCHGDLHLHNIVLIDGRPVPFDALEFDERLGTCDVLYDLAFLLMDMRHRGLAEQAAACLGAWIAARDGEEAGLSALPLFLALRAAIRAMVLVQTQRCAGREGAPCAEARAYLAEARRVLSPAAPRLVAIGGRSGTGKSTQARRIAPLLAPAGALHLSSDVLRKAMLDADPFATLPPEAYGAHVTARLYRTLVTRARTALAAGTSVVMDATFLGGEARAHLDRCVAASGISIEAIWLSAPDEELAHRVAARTKDVSDADTGVLALQSALAPPGHGWRVIDASGSADGVTARICRVLQLSAPL